MYYGLLNKYHSFISDSRLKGLSIRNLKVIDSSTIQLFSDILRGVGRNRLDGARKKGGFKVHAMMDAFSGVVESLKNMTNQNEYITESELARELGTTKRYVANIRLRGELPFIRFGGENGKVVYTRSDVARFMNKRKVGVY